MIYFNNNEKTIDSTESNYRKGIAKSIQLVYTIYRYIKYITYLAIFIHVLIPIAPFLPKIFYNLFVFLKLVSILLSSLVKIIIFVYQTIKIF